MKIVFWEEISWNKVSSKETPNQKKIHSFNHKPHYTKTMTTLTTNTSTDQCTQPSLPLNLQAVAEEDDNTITISWNAARKNDNCKHNKITKYEIEQTRSSHSEGDIMHTTQSTGETKEALSSFPTTPGISKLSSVEKILTYEVNEVNEVNDVNEVNEVDEVNVVTEHTEIELKFVINLIKGEEYTFAVRAMNENGTWSPWTNSVGPIFVPFETIFKVSQTQNIKFTNTCLFDFFHSSLILFIPTRFPECLFTSC